MNNKSKDNFKGSMLALEIVAATLIFAFLGPVNANAIEVGEKLRINGYIQNETGLRFEDHGLGYAEKGDLSLMRNTLQLDFKGRLTSRFSYSAQMRAWYEAVYDLDDDIDQRPEEHDENIDDIDLWHYSLSGDFGYWDFQIGRQELVWGESDLFRMADIVNPLDLSNHYIWTNLQGDGYRIPLRMAVIGFDPAWSNFRLETVLIPEHFEPFRLDAEGANFFPPAFQLPGRYDEANELIDEGRDNSDFDNFEAGARVKGLVGDVDVSVFYFYTRSDLPVLNFDPADSKSPLGFEAKFPRYNVVGGTANYYEPHLNTVFRFETAYNIDQPFTAMVYNPAVGQALPTVVEKDMFAYMIGFDHEHMFPWPEGRNVYFSGQMFQQYILDSQDNLFYPFMDETDDQTMFTFIVNTLLGFGNKWQPQILIGADTDGGGVFYPKLTYYPSDHWQVSLHYTNIWGDFDGGAGGGYFHPFEKNDEAWVQARLSF